MKKTPLILLAAVLASGAALAQAGDDTRHGGMGHKGERAKAAFAESDSNHDGRLSKAEWQAAQLRKSNERFQKLDLDRNGSLSQEEMQQSRGRHMGGRHGGMRDKLKALDTDGDQQLSRAELGDRLPKLAQNFDAIDADRDGKLSREEMRAARQARGEAQR